MTSSDSYSLQRKGLLHLPGINAKTKQVAEDILRYDVDSHHCFYRAPSIHNHLSHHLLAAYDLGGTASLLKKIEKRRETMQRPIQLDPKDKDIIITDQNWVQYVGNANAYYAYYNFFAGEIKSIGVTATLERYIFSEHANAGDAMMIIRTMSGALHPFIQIGYGVEFGHDQLVASGIAMAAVSLAFPAILFNFENPPESSASPNNNSNENRQTARGPSLLELLRDLYDNQNLGPPMPYDRSSTIYDWMAKFMKSDHPKEARRLISQYYVDEAGSDAEFDAKVEECIFASVLLTFATGKEGRKPRLDFFLMHLVTSSIFFPSLFGILKNGKHKADLLRGFVSNVVLLTILRGRPVIKPDLLMSYTDVPRPPVPSPVAPHATCLGDARKDEDYNPWPEMIVSGLPFPDSHHPKVMRALVYAAEIYGDVAPGSVIGAFLRESVPGHLKESHPGTAKMDGSIFVRAAGMTMDYMGWVTYGQTPRDDWDRSGLGWDEAWDDGQ